MVNRKLRNSRATDKAHRPPHTTSADIIPAQPPDFLNRLYQYVVRKAPRIAVVIPIILALMAALAWIVAGADSIKKLSTIVGLLPDDNEQLRMVVLKPLYPLDPLTASYQIEYSMDDPIFKPYADRLRSGLIQKGFGLKHHTFFVSKFGQDDNDLISLKPNQTLENENLAWVMLTFDESQFYFSNQKEDGNPIDSDTTIVYGCMNTSEFDHIVKFPNPDRVDARVNFEAWFSERIFAKQVWCKNIVRLGENSTARSALDLIGRKLRWDTSETFGDDIVVSGNLTYFALAFPFNVKAREEPPEFNRTLRHIHVKRSDSSINLTVNNLSLDDVFHK